MSDLPNRIDPATIEAGDRINIVLPRNQGIMHTISGTVESIEEAGGVNYYITREGGTLLAYHPSMEDIIVILISKKVETIFSENFWQDSETVKRIQ